MLDLSLGDWWIWYKKVWVTVYFVLSDTRVLEIYLSKIWKLYDEFLYDESFKFLPQPYTRLGKLPLIKYCLLCIEFSQVLLIPYERFLMLLKSRSRTHHLYMHYSYTVSTFPSTKKCYTSTLGVNIENIPIGSP
jgi:hypothetical protein